MIVQLTSMAGNTLHVMANKIVAWNRPPTAYPPYTVVRTMDGQCMEVQEDTIEIAHRVLAATEGK